MVEHQKNTTVVVRRNMNVRVLSLSLSFSRSVEGSVEVPCPVEGVVEADVHDVVLLADVHDVLVQHQ